MISSQVLTFDLSKPTEWDALELRSFTREHAPNSLSALLTLQAAGICASDLKAINMHYYSSGGYPRHPKPDGEDRVIMMGHEGGFHMTEIGRDLKHWINDNFPKDQASAYGVGRLFALHVAVPLPGFPNRMYGFSSRFGRYGIGSFASHIEVTSHEVAEALIPVPDDMPGYWTASREPIACCLRSARANRHRDARGDEYTGITPDGVVGLFAPCGAMGGYFTELLCHGIDGARPSKIVLIGKTESKLKQMVNRYKSQANGIDFDYFVISNLDGIENEEDRRQALRNTVLRLKEKLDHRELDDAFVIHPGKQIFKLAAKVTGAGGCVNLFSRPEHNDDSSKVTISGQTINLYDLKNQQLTICVEDLYLVSASGATKEDMVDAAKLPRTSGALQVTALTDFQSLAQSILTNGQPDGSTREERQHQLVQKTVVYPGAFNFPGRVNLQWLMDARSDSPFFTRTSPLLKELRDDLEASGGIFTEEMEVKILASAKRK